MDLVITDNKDLFTSNTAGSYKGAVDMHMPGCDGLAARKVLKITFTQEEKVLGNKIVKIHLDVA